MPATYLQVHVHIKARLKRAKQLKTTSTTMWIQWITVLWPSGGRLREKKGVAQKQRGDMVEVKRNNAGWSFWNAHALQPQNGTNGG